jgi:hypothetical protein
VYFIEQAIFGEGGHRARAIGTLRSRAVKDPDLAAMMPEINRLAGKWDRYRSAMRGQQPIEGMGQAAPAAATTPPAATTSAPDVQSSVSATTNLIRRGDVELGFVPTSEIVNTRGMTAEQLDAAGLPTKDLQSRLEDYSEETVSQYVNNYQRLKDTPITLIRGNDGRLYIFDGHSRFEANRVLGNQEVEVRVLNNVQAEEAARSVETVNLGQTKPTTMSQAVSAQRRFRNGEGDSVSKLATDFGVSQTKMRQLLDASYIDPNSELAERINGRMITNDEGVKVRVSPEIPLIKAAPIGRAIRDGRLTQREADAFARTILSKNMTAADVDDAVANLYRLKVENNGTLDVGALESDRMAQAQAAAQANRVEQRPWIKKREHYNGVRRDRGGTLNPDDQATLDTINAEIARLQTKQLEAQDEIREAFFQPNKPAQPTDLFGNPVAPGTPQFGRPREQGMDLGDAGRPQMQGGRQGTPGEALDANDLLNQPERSAADVMRDSGARGLFDMGIVRDPQREAGALYDATLGRRIRYETPTRRSPFLPDESPDIDPRLQVWGQNLSETEWKNLNQRFVDSQDTIFDRLRRYTDDVRREQPNLTEAQQASQAANRAFHDWNVDQLRRTDPKKAAKFDEEYARLMDKKDADAFQAQVEAMETAMGRNKPANFYDTYLGIQRELKLYNPITGGRYIATQAVGNTITALLVLGLQKGGALARMALSGEQLRGSLADVRGLKQIPDFFKVVDPDDIAPAFRAEDLLTPGITGDQTDWLMNELDYVTHGDVSRHVRDDTLGISAQSGATRVAHVPGKLLDQVNRLRLGRTHIPKETPAARRAARDARAEKVGDFTGWASSRWVRDLANTFDLTYRRSLWHHTMSGNIATVRNEFFDQLRNNLPAGSDVSRLDEILDALPAEFGSRRLREVLDEFGGNYAERMSRDWRSALGRMDRNARDEVNRIFFSGQETKFDAVVRRVFMFHYWMSRATPLYTEALMKNPGVANAYFKMIQESKEQAESGKYGKAVKGMLNIMDSWFGYNLFIRPDAFMQTVFSWGNDSNFSNEDQSELWRFMSNVGLMPSPMIDAFLNLTGYQGQNSFTPDLLGFSTHFNFGSSMIDYVKVQMGMDVSEPTVLGPETLLAQVRAQTSGWLPGSVNVDFAPPTSYATVEINQNILDLAEEDGLDWDDPQERAVIIGAMEDPDSDLYRRAFERYANSNAAEWVLRFVPVTSILYPKLRQGGADRRREELANAVPGSDEQQRLRDMREAAITDDPATRTLRIQSDEYQNLGDTRDQERYRQYNAIRFGELGGSVRVGGVDYGEHQLRAMSEDDRSALADQWAAEGGFSDGIERQRQLREDYRASHPEYAAYYDWSTQVRDYEGGPVKYWEDLVKANPNAARWYRENITENMPLSQMERQLTGINGFIAQQGMRPSAYDPSPISTNNPSAVPYNPAAVNGSADGTGQGQTSDPAQGIAQDIADYRQEAAEIDAQLAGLFGEGTTWATIENANPTLQAALLQHMETAGIRPPSLSRRASGYLQWAESQPPGSDTSINAYLAWQEQFQSTTAVPANAGSLPASTWTGTTPP